MLNKDVGAESPAFPSDPRLERYRELLRDALHALNEVPNTAIRSGKYRNTYDVAKTIQEALRT